VLELEEEEERRSVRGKDRRKEGEEVKGQPEKRTHEYLCTVQINTKMR
jgi:hypothetical protein